MSSSVSSLALWQKRVGDLLPSLSRSQALVLGLLSYGMVILDGCGMTRLCNGLAKIEQVPANRLRQRLREFYYEAEALRWQKASRGGCADVLCRSAPRDIAGVGR
jgi:hypothetical protein